VLRCRCGECTGSLLALQLATCNVRAEETGRDATREWILRGPLNRQRLAMASRRRRGGEDLEQDKKQARSTAVNKPTQRDFLDKTEAHEEEHPKVAKPEGRSD